jgi:hypothetical protein
MPHRSVFSRAHATLNCVTRSFVTLTFLAAALLTACVAHAGQIDIHFNGLNLVYDGTDIYDAVSSAGGTGDPAQADPLSSMSFFVNGSPVGTVLTSDIFADVLIEDVQNIPVGGGVVISGGNGDAFGFDLLTKNELGGWGVALHLDTLQVFYTGSEIAIAGAGLASDLFFQDLPFGLDLDPSEPITIAFSTATLSNVTSSGGFLTGFVAAGTGNISGMEREIPIPEPGTFVLAGIGLFASGMFVRRRRK